MVRLQIAPDVSVYFWQQTHTHLTFYTFFCVIKDWPFGIVISPPNSHDGSQTALRADLYTQTQLETTYIPPQNLASTCSFFQHCLFVSVCSSSFTNNDTAGVDSHLSRSWSPFGQQCPTFVELNQMVSHLRKMICDYPMNCSGDNLPLHSAKYLAFSSVLHRVKASAPRQHELCRWIRRGNKEAGRVPRCWSLCN